MSSVLYIITDAAGEKSKIGRTDNLAQRLSGYGTHNPDYRLYRTYDCSEEASRRTETAIKLIFKDKLTGQGREWFEVRPQEMDRHVNALMHSSSEDPITPSMHGVKLTETAHELQSTISKIVKNHLKTDPGHLVLVRRKLMEHFAHNFSLGIPEHKLPDNVVRKDPLIVDLNHCDAFSNKAKAAIKNKAFNLPHERYPKGFYQLVKLASGHFVAVCTARVSTPYLDAIDGQTLEMTEAAHDLGWHTTFHHDWTWEDPAKTGVVLFQQKSPAAERIRSWENSFRKWVIERAEILKNERFHDPATLIMTVEDTVEDATFPMDVRSAQDLYDHYLRPYWLYGDHEKHYRRDSYNFLFDRWNKSLTGARNMSKAPGRGPRQAQD